MTNRVQEITREVSQHVARRFGAERAEADAATITTVAEALERLEHLTPELFRVFDQGDPE
jgi:hypothetical protein